MDDEATRADVRASLLKYLDTDTVWYAVMPASRCPIALTDFTSFYQDDPPPLVRLQKEHWDPLLDWVRTEFEVEITTSDSVLFNSQPETTKQKLDQVMSKFDRWQMAGQYHASQVIPY
jgi:ATP synthase mitochondrial F1 complex assembly factor 2